MRFQKDLNAADNFWLILMMRFAKKYNSSEVDYIFWLMKGRKNEN